MFRYIFGGGRCFSNVNVIFAAPVICRVASTTVYTSGGLIGKLRTFFVIVISTAFNASRGMLAITRAVAEALALVTLGWSRLFKRFYFNSDVEHRGYIVNLG